MARTANRLLIFAALLSLANPVSAQCGDGWIPAPGMGLLGFDGYQYTNASVIWDADGAGPSPELLVIVGGFDIAGDHHASRIVGWDGTRWINLPQLPEPSSGQVLLEVLDGSLMASIWLPDPAGGYSTQFFRLEGAAWIPLEARLAQQVNLLVAFSGELFAGVHLFGSPPAERLMKLTHAGWTPAGSGFTKHLSAVEVFNNKLIVAGVTGDGIFDGTIREWNGASWRALAPDRFGVVSDFIEHDGTLFCAGRLNLQPGGGLVARLVGENWEPFGDAGGTTSVKLAEYAGNLVVASDRSMGAVHRPPAAWNGNGWVSLGEGLQRVGTSVYVASLIEIGGELVAIGNFLRADSYAVRGMARWDGARWKTMSGGFSDQVFSLTEHQGRLIASGVFENIGDLVVNDAAVWNGDAWSALNGPSEFDAEGFGPMYSNGVELLTCVESGSQYEVKRWTSSGWETIGGRFNQPAGVLHFHDGVWYAGGAFTTVGGQSIRGLAWLDGSVWRALSQPFASSTGQIWVFALTTYEGDLVAAGRFDRAGETVLNNIARWNGSNWSPFGSGFESGQVLTIAQAHGQLIVGGNFPGASSAGRFVPSASAIAWDGHGWASMDRGVTNSPQPTAYVRALLEFEGGVFAAGDFTGGSGNSLNAIARWDGRRWRPLGSGLTGSDFSSYYIANCLESFEGRLFVGSRYFNAGPVVSPYLARWEYPSPTIVWQPPNASVALNNATTLECKVAGPGDFSVQWFRGSSPVVNGITPWGSNISGAQTRSLTLTGARYEDEGSYYCLVATVCGNVTSESATVDVIPPPCAADVNGDVRIDGRDLSTLLSQFGRTVEPGTGVDFSGDGVVNGIDLSVLLSTFGQSCTN